MRRFDSRMTVLIQELPAGLRPAMHAISFFGHPIIVLTIGFSGYITAIQRGRTDIQLAFIYAAIAFGLNIILKSILHRRRPHNLEVMTFGLRSYSFPSGHAFGSVIYYGLFSYLDFKYIAHPWNVIISSLLWVMILLIGISRVYLKTHYPSDIIGGWLLGFISLVVIITLAF